VKRFRFRLGATVYFYGMEAIVIDRLVTSKGGQVFEIKITDGSHHGRPIRLVRKEFLTRDPPVS
tara:strand:+ start:555 stop:746 length:192 start_codon:yes stop_codon:yes gene_type:complete